MIKDKSWTAFHTCVFEVILHLKEIVYQSELEDKACTVTEETHGVIRRTKNGRDHQSNQYKGFCPEIIENKS